MKIFDFDDLVRYLSVTSLVAFVAVCLALSIAVWIRRNRIRIQPSSGLILSLVGIAFLCTVVLGLRHVMIAHHGIVGAHDVFTVRSRSDATATVVTMGDAVKRGDPLVRFEVPGLASRMVSLDSRIMTVREQLQSSDLQPLQPNAAITERKRRLTDELAQARSILLELQKSSRENHRALLDSQSQYSERLGQLDLQIASNNQVSAIAASQLAITQDALGRTMYLRQQGIENISASENRLTDRLSRELTLKKATSDIAAMERMKADMQAMRATSVAFLSATQTGLERQVDGQEEAIAALRHRLDDVEHDEADDRQRAADARRHDREAMLHEIRGIEAEKSALVATTTIEAPFAGTIIYRNTAPGIVSSNSLLVALAPASGFTARVRVGNEEVPFLAQTSHVVFEFADADLLTRFVPGSYKTIEPVPFESSESIVTFDIALPPEMIERLTRSAEPLGVSLAWMPPLLGDPLFLYSLMSLSGTLMLAAIGRFFPLRMRGAVAFGAARLLLPLLWWVQPTEAIARLGAGHAGVSGMPCSQAHSASHLGGAARSIGCAITPPPSVPDNRLGGIEFS